MTWHCVCSFVEIEVFTSLFVEESRDGDKRKSGKTKNTTARMLVFSIKKGTEGRWRKKTSGRNGEIWKTITAVTVWQSEKSHASLLHQGTERKNTHYLVRLG